jgi:hypothetical protein
MQPGGLPMTRNLFQTIVAVAGIGATLGACAPSVSFSDLSRPGYGINPVPAVNLDAPYGSGTSYSLGSQQPCLASNYGCTPQMQLQWAEAHQR